MTRESGDGLALARRAFLARLCTSLARTAAGAATLGPLASACAGSRGRTGNEPTDSPAPDTQEPGSKAPRALRQQLGVQLFTVRREMRRDVRQTLARVARIGYREVEFAGYFDTPPATLKAMLARVLLTAPSAHVPLDALVAPQGAMLDAAHTIGHRYLVAPSLPAPRPRTLDDYRRLAETFNSIGQALEGAGLRFAFHNHDSEFAPIGGRIPYELLLEETNPSLVWMELDLYWAVKAGVDPLDLIRRYPGRFSLMHAKDSSGPPGHRIREVGRGTIDFAAIIGAGLRNGLEHVFVEHDDPANPIESLTGGFKHLSLLIL